VGQSAELAASDLGPGAVRSAGCPRTLRSEPRLEWLVGFSGRLPIEYDVGDDKILRRWKVGGSQLRFNRTSDTI